MTIAPDRPETDASRDEAGFTMIELMVVLGIIAILVAVMIPNFLKARQPAQDRQAQNLLRNSLTAAKAVETADGVSPTQVSLSGEEPAVAFLASSSTAPANERSVSVANGVTGGAWYLILASHSTSGRCFALLELQNATPQFQRVDNAVTCQADQFTPVAGWLTAWP